MAQIIEDYCSFETAKLLKEKGFESDYCHTAYDSNGEFFWCGDYSKDRKGIIDAPTLQMAMKWLREVHHCVICIIPLTFYGGEIGSSLGYCIWADDNTKVNKESSPRLESYEEACESAIKYCLEKLI